MAAGAVGGLSVAIKITGLWYVFAVVLYLLFSDGSSSRSDSREYGSARLYALGYRAVAVAVPAVVLAVVGSVLSSNLGAAEVVNFFLPVAAVCAVALWSGLRLAVPDARERVFSLLRLVVPFLLGVSGPLALLLIPYVVTGSLGDLYAGTLVTPQERLQTTYVGTAGPAAFIFALPVITVFCVCRRRGRAARGLDRVASAAFVVLLASTVTVVGYQILWHTTAALVPMGILLGVALLAVSRRAARVEERPVLFLLLALAAFTSLVQFPFGAPVYLCFVAPLAVLAWLAMFRFTDFTFRLHGVFPLVFLGSIIVFGFVVSHGVLYRMGLRPVSNPQTVILDRGTAWIRVSPKERSIYRRTALLLRRHSTGAYIYRRTGYAGTLRASGTTESDEVTVRSARPLELGARRAPVQNARAASRQRNRRQFPSRVLGPPREGRRWALESDIPASRARGFVRRAVEIGGRSAIDRQPAGLYATA